jgi:hypothetical protein
MQYGIIETYDNSKSSESTKVVDIRTITAYAAETRPGSSERQANDENNWSENK